MEKDLTERLFNFAIAVLKYLRTIKDDYESKVIKNQLVKSRHQLEPILRKLKGLRV